MIVGTPDVFVITQRTINLYFEPLPNDCRCCLQLQQRDKLAISAVMLERACADLDVVNPESYSI